MAPPSLGIFFSYHKHGMPLYLWRLLVSLTVQIFLECEFSIYILVFINISFVYVDKCTENFFKLNLVLRFNMAQLLAVISVITKYSHILMRPRD